MTDPIADMLTRVRNALAANKETVEVPSSNMKKAIADIMLAEGYVSGVSHEEDGYNGKIVLTLKYVGNHAQSYGRTGNSYTFHQQGYYDGQAGKGQQRWRRSALLHLVKEVI